MKIKNNKGSIAVFVLVGLVFMSSYLLILYGSNLNKSKLAKDQYDMISMSYSYNDSDEEAYERAYSSFKKNKDVKNIDKIELKNIIPVNILNYKIQAGTSGLGVYRNTDKKYAIKIEVTNNGTNKKTYTMALNNPLKKGEYIDWEKGIVFYANETVKEEIYYKPPVITNSSEQVEIKVVGNTPAKIEVEYMGYNS